MNVLEGIAIAAAGCAAGTINTVVGSGTLITFPVLVAFGYTPLVANVSNTVGLVPGVVSGTYGYRRELAGQRGRLIRLGTAGVLGGALGAMLLFVLPASAFATVVPVLIGLALVLVLVQPRLARWLAARRTTPADHHGGPLLVAGVFATGIYGGYFGAAQGVLLLGLLGVFLADDMQRLNGAKNVIAMLVNAVAGIIFIAASHVAWAAAGLIAGGSIVGGQLGAGIGRRLSPFWLRALIVCVGITAIVKLVA